MAKNSVRVATEMPAIVAGPSAGESGSLLGGSSRAKKGSDMKRLVRSGKAKDSRHLDPSRFGKTRKLMTTEEKMREAVEKAHVAMVTAMTAPDLGAKLQAAMPKGLMPLDYVIIYQQALLGVAARGLVSVIREYGGNPTGDKNLAKMCADSLRQRIDAELVE
jgi:hypothetical protein